MNNEKIKKQALELSSQERAELAHLLIESLQSEKKYETEEAWSEELKNRIKRYKEGKSASKPWSEVKNLRSEVVKQKNGPSENG